MEDNSVPSFGRKRVCILTKHPVSILESFKIIVKGKVFMIRAKELFTWNPSFVVNKETSSSSDDESVQGEMHKFYSRDSGKQNSEDPFELYDLLEKKSLEMNILSINVQGLGNKTKKEWIKELSINHKLNFIAIQETKMDKISHMDVKLMWGNSNYDFVCSDSLGNSGGILCIWETSIFKKDHVTISDNFVAIYGTWLPSNAKFLFISIYAPQQPVHKRDLWDYLSVLLGRWNGEAILMGDFNEVRSKDERRGSWFNPSGARDFNHFISSSGLVDVKLEGYSFTWSHPSTTKMSKLERFRYRMVVLLFPSISALCLDLHLSDHRPILLREVQLDFGLIPFRFYHSWFSYDGFDELVEQTWRSFLHSDRNGMIRFRKKLQDLKITIRQWIRTNECIF
ncbi:RNA-directed DNA polymerase, eukaryota [Tanacetum coccineum]